MIQYIYFVKCPGCEDEHFDFFDEAKTFALSCLSSKPIITQTEVNRNDFGECTDSCDLGTVWSWEDTMKETDAEPAKCIFTKDDLKDYCPDSDPEFDNIDNSLDFEVEEPVTSEVSAVDEISDNFRKPIPEGMTIESLVEEMEENEDTVECKSCEELFDKATCDYVEGHGWLCTECKDVLSASSKLLPFKESTDNTEKAAELDDTTLLYYKDLTVTVSGDEIPGGYYDPPEWEDIEYTDEYEYEVDTDEIAGVIYDKYLTDEDVPGGISTLDDDDVWEKFWIDNLEKLVEKYNSQLLDYYREDAEEDAYETFQERYDNEREAARDEYYERQAEDRYWRERELEL